MNKRRYQGTIVWEAECMNNNGWLNYCDEISYPSVARWECKEFLSPGGDRLFIIIYYLRFQIGYRQNIQVF